MINCKQLKKITAYCTLLLLTLMAGRVNAQLVTNGDFENSNVGVVNNADVKGWLIQIASTVTPAPVLQIVSDTVEHGNRALKVTVHGLGTNPWDIQAVADSIPVVNGRTYNYSIWAKADKPGAQVNFTMGNYAYSEYKVIRPANLTTSWQKFSMQFTVADNQAFIRGPIHFSLAGDTGNSIYLDNLQIVDANAANEPVIVEAESGQLGSNYAVKDSGGVKYVTPISNYTGLSSPGDTSRMITYNVTFPDSGIYNLFVHLRVGPAGFNDDSFFYGKGFGEKNDTAATDWVFINGLAAAGFADSAQVVDGPGSLGSGMWKWVNITRNSYQGTPGDSFYVSVDSLNKTFQIGSREDGLDIDKIAFGKHNLYFTVNSLNNDLPGTVTLPGADTVNVWQGPALAAGQGKFLGNADDNPATFYSKYWTQITPGNAGKWGSVAGVQDTNQWNWTGLTRVYNYAQSNHLIFKDHNLIWGQQQPSWISALDSATQYKYIETWIRMVGQKYPNTDMIDVVNEPLNGHNPPDGGGTPARANYKKALGGNGVTGWDWVINAFTLARKYLPHTKLLINDYGIINDNGATTSYFQIINLLKARNLIDGIGVQGHRFELEGADTSLVRKNLDKLASTGIPIYISEFDLGNLNDSGTPNDNTQLQLYQKVFPILWKHPGVYGITLWGYIQDQMWQVSCYLINSNLTSRPAFNWLASFVKANPMTGVLKDPSASVPTKYELMQNYPNPFNPTTNIQYNIPKTSIVSLRIYDVLGRLVQTLVNTEQKPGSYSVTFNAQNLSSGVYFYQINAGSFSVTKKLLLLK
jgi:endo-1,4-beta-xylanase